MALIFPKCIETERLQLERLSMASVDPVELYRICSSDDGIEDVTEYVSWSPHEMVSETIRFITAVEAA